MKGIMVFLTLALSFNVHATRFYTESGKIIQEGDSVGKLMMYAGNPTNRRSQVICVAQKRDYCTRWGRVEYWYYPDIKHENMFWVISVMGDKVINLKWDR
jgi:hypothetical protein